jgi:hypothetical protein
VALTDLDEVRSPAERYGLQVFLAVAFHADTPRVFARAREALAAQSDPEVVRRARRAASRCMVQAAFAVVMARDGVWPPCWKSRPAWSAPRFPGGGGPPAAPPNRAGGPSPTRPWSTSGEFRRLLERTGWRFERVVACPGPSA